jgi:hypothetical protein
MRSPNCLGDHHREVFRCCTVLEYHRRFRHYHRSCNHSTTCISCMVSSDVSIEEAPRVHGLWNPDPVRTTSPFLSILLTLLSITPLTIFRMYFFNTISSPSFEDQTLTSYHVYLATTIQLNFAIVVACLPFLKPFMESMSSGGFASTLKPMNSSYAAGSKSSTFVLGKSNRKAFTPRSSFMMDSMIDSRVSGTENRSNTDTNGMGFTELSLHHTKQPPSFHFGLHGNSQGNLGTLRPDKVTSFSHIGAVTPEENSARSSTGSDKMIIKRTTAWQVQEFYEYGDGISKVTDEIIPVPDWRAKYGAAV